MRFVGNMKVTTEVEQMTIIPPCEGYYTDISIQIQNIADAVNQPYNWIYFGSSRLDADIMDLLDVVGVTIVPDYKPSNGIYQTYGGAASTVMKWKHFGKKRVYVGKDDKLSFMHYDNHANPDSMILIQGKFIPRVGCIYKRLVNVGVSAVGDDWISANRYKFPLDLAKCQIEVTAHALWVDTNANWELFFKLNDKGEDQFVDTIADGAGDIQDTDFIEQDNLSGHGLVGKLPVKIDSVDITSQHRMVLNIGSVKRGDFISWDSRLVSGVAGANTITLAFTIIGIIPKKTWSEEALFIDSRFLTKINPDGTLDTESI